MFSLSNVTTELSMKPKIILEGIIGALFVGVMVLFSPLLRRWYSRWGATEDEVDQDIPGDEFVPHPKAQLNMAVTVQAPAEEVWPWFVQLGCQRGGWYSYDLLDNGAVPSADRILPEYQSLQVGNKILMMPGMGFVVKSIDPPLSIVSVLEDGSTSWCLGLYPIEGGGTRLVSRWRL